MSYSIVVLDAIASETIERMRTLLPPGFSLEGATENTESHRAELIRNADFAVSGQVAVTDEVLRSATRLKLLHKWGVGTDNFALDTAAELNIPVARTTGSNAVPVAEFTLGLMISALRHIAPAHERLAGGEWRSRRAATPFMLTGKTVGLVGFGAIAKALAKLLQGFGCDVVYFKPTSLSPEEESLHNVRHVSFSRLIQSADVVSLHCPLTPATRGLVDRSVFEQMKSTAVLINTARGEIVDESALIWALNEKVIHAAAVDVYEVEPLPSNSPLTESNNLTHTPHLGAVTADTFEPNVRRMFANIECVANGRGVPEIDSVLR